MLLQVKDLTVGFATDRGLARAVDGVGFELPAGGSLCLVGESGCGKSVTALSLLRLLPAPPARVLAGQARFDGRDLLRLPEAELARLRGARIGMVFQEPMTSLNPVFRVGEQVAEPLALHRGLKHKAALARAVELLEQVGIAQAGERALDYPHQLSGGQRQRVMIAMAMACGPALLIADEPTTALDVSVQGQILELLRGLRRDQGAALLLITHDLEVAAASAENLAVMYAGKIVEHGRTGEVLADPLHPYTRGLMASRPRLPEVAGADGPDGKDRRARLTQVRR
ncbi:MAG: ABC transporter ATP-binding protein, partial [Deltaproteobacteria bacterium]|nr:ABC transporter ATP-binding protein [Deltaproteobacteria bacterium]